MSSSLSRKHTVRENTMFQFDLENLILYPISTHHALSLSELTDMQCMCCARSQAKEPEPNQLWVNVNVSIRKPKTDCSSHSRF